jgi:hypothetical protein
MTADHERRVALPLAVLDRGRLGSRCITSSGHCGHLISNSGPDGEPVRAASMPNRRVITEFRRRVSLDISEPPKNGRIVAGSG